MMLTVNQKAVPDDFTYGKLTSDRIVLEERSMCLVHPVALNSDGHILSGCFAVVCVCVYTVCVCHRLPHTASRNRKQGKV